MENNAVYLRKSRADQGTLEETLRKHKKTLLEFAAAHGLRVAPEDIYEEVVSGDSLYARPQMLRLLEQVELKRYGAVLCMDIDRLGRGNMSDQGIIVETFKNSGTKIITPSQAYDLNDEIDENNVEFAAFMARFEYKQIKKRLRAGVRRSIQDGCYLSNAPYGYRRAVVNKRHTLEIYEDEAKYVRLIFDMYVNRGLGSQHIADAINAMGAKPHRAERFGRTSIMAILKNPAYIGKIVWDKKSHVRKGAKGNAKHITIYNPKEKWTITNGLHPPIIDEETYRRAQEIINGKYHPPSFNGTVLNPLAGLVECKNCGAIMQRAANMKGGPYCLCQKRGCIPMTKLPFVEQAVLDQLRTAAQELLTAPGKQQNDPAAVDCKKFLRDIDGKIKTVKGQLGRLHDLLEQGVYDVDTFLTRQNEVGDKLSALEQQREAVLAQAQAHRQIDTKRMAEQILHVLDVYPAAEPFEKNLLLKSILAKAIYFKEKGWKPAQFEVELVLKPIFF